MRSTRWLMIGLLSLAMAASPAVAVPADDARIAAQAAHALESVATPTGPGVAVLIARGDRIIYRSARGDADIELGVPLRPDQVFRIASVTKMFTAALVLKLAEQGKLSLDDPLSRYLPDFPNAAGITLRQLLTHTAGVSDKAVLGQPGFGRRDVDTATLVAEIARRPPAFAPGSAQSYSNAGFILLGAVIEKVTGQPWHVALHDRLLAPLGLQRTGYGIAATVIPGRVAGYTTDNPDHQVRNAAFISATIPAAAGALVSTLDDLRLWMRALTGGRVIGEASYRQMIAPVAPGGVMPGHPYGMGMYVWGVRGETMIGHTGQIDGFASVLAYLPSRDITIVALGNDDNFDAQNFGRRLAAIALGKPYPVIAGVPIPAATLDALIGAYQEGPIVRTLTAKDGKLFAQRGGGNVVPLQMTADGQLHFVPDELSYFVPVRDAAGAVVRLDYFNHGDGPPVAAPRITATAH
jgi:CubicO group peptidase (beta-lactamase class C family)